LFGSNPQTQTFLVGVSGDGGSRGVALGTVEAGIDAFKILECICPPPCPPATGDVNNDGFLDGLDIQRFSIAMLGGGSPSEVCAGDFNTSHALDIGDVPGFVAALFGP